jgi:hypothetical protein
MIDAPDIIEAPRSRICQVVSWPETLERHLAALPRRWLLRNDRVSILLTGLDGGGFLTLGPWTQACLLVATFGILHVVIGQDEFCLRETDSLVIVPQAKYELRAPNTADFLLMNLTLANSWSHRCLCHGTGARNEMLEATQQLLGVHAQL